MKKFYLLLLAMLFGIALLAAGISSVYAQEDDSDEFTLEEITVTAQKRAENQQKVPIAMEVLSGEDLAISGQNNVNEILKNVSNAIISNTDFGMRVTVRGLNESNDHFNNMRVSTPTVAINFDGTYNTEETAGQNLFDVERVEVLYGPQSTLYGSNSPGGIVNIVTASPKTDRYSTSGSVEYGSFDLLNANVALNAPIYSDMVAMRLSAQRTEHGSWVESSDNDSKSTSVRLKTLYQPTEDLSMTLTGTWGSMNNGGQMGGSVDLFVDQDDVPGTPWDYVSEEEDTGGGAPPGGGGGGGGIGADQISKSISADIAWDTALVSLSITPSYSKSDADETSESDMDMNVGGVMTTVEDVLSYSENWTEQESAEVRASSPENFPFTWIAGGTYYKSHRENNTTYEEFPESNSYGVAEETNKGLYANITYPITDTFSGSVGYRYSWDKASNVEDPAKKGSGITGMDYSAPDYKIGVEYNPGKNNMLYASFATSYRVNMMGGIDPSADATTDYWRDIPPEKMNAYTLGSKSRFFSNRLQVNTSAYFYDYKNREFQIDEAGRLGEGDSTIESDYLGRNVDGDLVEGAEGLYPDFDDDGVMDTTPFEGDSNALEDYWTKHVGEFQSYGIDLSANWLITSNDRFDLSVSWMHTEWTKAVYDLYWWWLWTDADGQISGRDYSGMEKTFSPEWSGTLAYQHNFTLGSLGTLVPHVDIQYKSSYLLSTLSDDEIASSNGDEMRGAQKQEAYYLVDGNISFNHSSGIWSLSAYVKNATNYAVKTSWIGQGANAKIGLNDPRSYGAILSLKF